MDKRKNMPQQQTIILEVRQTIGEVHSDPYGTSPMVEEAFKVAGKYLNELPLGKDQRGAHVEFEYMGIKFSADAWVEGMDESEDSH